MRVRGPSRRPCTGSCPTSRPRSTSSRSIWEHEAFTQQLREKLDQRSLVAVLTCARELEVRLVQYRAADVRWSASSFLAGSVIA